MQQINKQPTPMLPILPRELLWTDLKTMEEFIELDPLNREFVNVYLRTREKHLPGSPAGPVALFNEAYYEVTRILFEAPRTSNTFFFDAHVIPMGMDNDMVRAMVYHLLWLCDEKACGVEFDLIDDVMSRFKKRYMSSLITTAGCFLTEICKQLREKGKSLSYPFKPRPLPIQSQELYTLNWRKITNYYDQDSIEEVVKLWEDKEDQSAVRFTIDMKRQVGGTPLKAVIHSSGRLMSLETTPPPSKPDFAALQAQLKRKEREIEALKAKLEAAEARQQDVQAEQEDTEEIISGQQEQPEAEKPTLFAHPSLDIDERWKVHHELKRLVEQSRIQDICGYLKKLIKEERVFLPQSPTDAYNELLRLGMPEKKRGFSYKNFQKHYCVILAKQ